MKKPRKAKTAAQLAEACAVDLQLLVRLKASDDNGYCQCVTCGKVDHYKQMQGGHFIERGRTATKLIEENIHPQCPYCNLRKMKTASGVLLYREFMVETYGEDFVKKMEISSRAVHKWIRADIENIHHYTKAQLTYHKNRVGL
jgi:hypothetical protein